MIVKNEAHVIKRTLENICAYIPLSYYVISDTGSSDNTKEIIKTFFDSKNIKGEIYDDLWQDFGTNRTLALKHAYKKSDYLFIFDADDMIHGELKMPDNLTDDYYFFKFGDTVVYKRGLLINNQYKWEFIGVLHEYLECIDNKYVKQSFIEGNYFIDSGKTGDRSKDPMKYSKDAQILEKAFYEAEKNNNDIKVRYSFYCAQSYRDSKQREKAIEWYKKRLSFLGWDQEVYFSCLMIGNLYNELNESEKAVYYWRLASQYENERYESLFYIINHFRLKKCSKIAYQYYLMIKNKNISLDDKLFATFSIYNYLLDCEIVCIFFDMDKIEEGVKTFQNLFLNKNVDINNKLLLLNKLDFYFNKIPFNLNFVEDYFNFVQKIYLESKKINNTDITVIKNINDKIFKKMSSYTCANINNLRNCNPNSYIDILLCIKSNRYEKFEKTVNSLLKCFKDINKVDYFLCIDNNSSKEDRKKMIVTYPFFKYYFKKENDISDDQIINNKLNELKATYLIQIDDDCIFIKPTNYIEKSIKLFKKYDINKIFFNKNCVNDIDQYNTESIGERVEDYYLLHNDNNNDNNNDDNHGNNKIRSVPSISVVNSKFNKNISFNEITYISTKMNEEVIAVFYVLNQLPRDLIAKDNHFYCVKPNKKTFVLSEYIAKMFLNNNFNGNNNVVYSLYTYFVIFKKIESLNMGGYFLLTTSKKELHFDFQKIFDKNDRFYDIIILNKDYLIHNTCICKIINYIEENGFIEKDIEDIFIKSNLLINKVECPELVHKEVTFTIEDNTDFYDFKKVILEMKDYIFLKNKDHYGDDICHLENTNLNNLIFNCDSKTDAIAFNTLGYIKNVVDLDKLFDLNTGRETDGIYINIKRFNEKYGRNISIS